MDLRMFRWVLIAMAIIVFFVALQNIEYRSAYLIISVCLIIVYIVGVFRKCPKCKSWWAASENSSKELRRWMSTKIVKKTDIIRDKNGNKTGSIEREETVPVSYSEIMHVYKCKYCGACWSKTKTHES